jgi:uncharacterized protein (TIGR02145 family)
MKKTSKNSVSSYELVTNYAASSKQKAASRKPSRLLPSAFCLLLLAFLFLLPASAQVTIGKDAAPKPSSVLELHGQYQTGVYGGLRLPLLSTTERDAITGLSDPEAKGLTIYNTTTNCIEFWNGTAWKSLCNAGIGGGDLPGGTGGVDPWEHIECGAYISPSVYKKFMCRNLGASTTTHPFMPSADLTGNYYQWGAPTPIATRDGLIGPWNATPPLGWYGNNTTGTSVTVKSVFDPCPAGYRIPSYNEWAGVFANNPRINIGTFDMDSWSGVLFGDNLFLPATGYCASSGVSLMGYYGAYWTNRSASATQAYLAEFYDWMERMSTPFGRINAHSIRCIAE